MELELKWEFSVKWKLEIEMKLLENGIRIEVDFFRMEITLAAGANWRV